MLSSIWVAEQAGQPPANHICHFILNGTEWSKVRQVLWTLSALHADATADGTDKLFFFFFRADWTMALWIVCTIPLHFSLQACHHVVYRSLSLYSSVSAIESCVSAPHNTWLKAHGLLVAPCSSINAALHWVNYWNYLCSHVRGSGNIM